MKYLIVLLLLSGCSYASHSVITAKGDQIKVPFHVTSIKGENVDFKVDRTMEVGFLYWKKKVTTSK